jgi:hypothetical protein
VGLRNSPAWYHSFRVAAPGEFRSERPNNFVQQPIMHLLLYRATVFNIWL